MKNTKVKLIVDSGVSILCTFYAVILVFLGYMSFFYEIIVPDNTVFIILNIGVSLFFGTLMVYTRKVIFTSILSLIMVPLLLPVILFNLQNPAVFIPFAVVVITMYFISGASEGVKTVFGAIFILLYIVGGLAFFLMNTLLSNKIDAEEIAKYTSPTGDYRCYVMDVDDSSTGSTKIFLEPTYFDENYGLINFKAKGYTRTVYNYRNHDPVNVEWKNNDLYVNGKLRFRESMAIEEKWFEPSNRVIEF